MINTVLAYHIMHWSVIGWISLTSPSEWLVNAMTYHMANLAGFAKEKDFDVHFTVWNGGVD